jgi:AraC-like DNA-binding protein
MIGGVNPLTARATSAAVTLPTFGSGAVRPLLDGLERLGHDRARLLAAAGLSDEALADPDTQVPCTVAERLVGQACQERPRVNLALELATVTPLGAYPLIDYLAVSSRTVGEGLAQVARYYALLDVPGSLELRASDDPIEVRYGGQASFGVEYSVALCLLHLARESEGRARARVVRFMHRPGDARAYEQALGCPVEVGAEWNGFAMSRETWRLPMRRRDPILLSVLERHAEDVLTRRPRSDDAVEQVRHALARGLTSGEGAIAPIARSLALTPRTLQRRLAASGTTFQRVLEETRREAAIRHLEHSELSIAEIAFVLGYSEPAAFHRAFRRWQGATPRDFRARSRAGVGA